MTERKPLDRHRYSPRVEQLLNFLKARVKGQDRPINYLADLLEEVYAGISEPGKPISNILFLGPPGCGKTLLVERLAEYLFGNPRGITRIHCAEYQEWHTVSNLKGSPKGYVGYDEEPVLSQWNLDKYDFIYRISKRKNRKKINPGEVKQFEIMKKQLELEEARLLMTNQENSPIYAKIEKSLAEVEEKIEKAGVAIYRPKDPNQRYLSIVLFDEIEKASDAVHRLLLGIMDKGELDCGPHGVTDFSCSLIFMTSNVGSQGISDYFEELRANKVPLGFSPKPEEEKKNPEEETDEKIKDLAKSAMEQAFPAEFLRRLDEYIVFRHLSRATIEEIFDLEIELLKNRLAGLKIQPWVEDPQGANVPDPLEIEIAVDREVKDFIVEKTMQDTKSGASRLTKLIKRYLVRRYIARARNSFRIISGDTIHFKMGDIDGQRKVIAEVIRSKSK